jgi:hypothetical protein
MFVCTAVVCCPTPSAHVVGSTCHNSSCNGSSAQLKCPAWFVCWSITPCAAGHNKFGIVKMLSYTLMARVNHTWHFWIQLHLRNSYDINISFHYPRAYLIHLSSPGSIPNSIHVNKINPGGTWGSLRGKLTPTHSSTETPADEEGGSEIPKDGPWIQGFMIHGCIPVLPSC